VKWEMVGQPIEEKGSLKAETRESLLELADAMAEKLKG
jgi:hypothetical protein